VCKIRVNIPVSCFVGFGQCGTFDWRTKSSTIKIFLVRRQADFYIAQTFSMRELSKGHCQKLFPAGKTPNAFVAVITSHANMKIVIG